MSHGADGGSHHGGPSGGSAFDHPGAMHGLGYDHGSGHHGMSHHGFDPGAHGYSHHGGNAMYAAIHGGSQSAAHYGSHAVVMLSGLGLGIGGHVISTVNDGHAANDGHGGHIDGPGANRINPKDLRIGDIKGARLLVGHALCLVDRGSGWYGPLLDGIATSKKIGLARIDSRPNLKGEDMTNLDGIYPWNAWGDPKSTVGPDGYLPLLRGRTDKIIHVFAIPNLWVKIKGVWTHVVRPDEQVTMSVRLTVWHYAQTKDVEVKIEVIVSSCYVFDQFQNNQYTFYGRRTKALEVKALQLMQEVFATLTDPSEQACPGPRKEYGDAVNRLPGTKGQPKSPAHPVGVHVGDAAEDQEIENEDVAKIRKNDRDIENQVGTTPAPTPAPAGGGGDDDDAEGLVAAIANPAVAPPKVPAGPVTGVLNVPGDLKK